MKRKIVFISSFVPRRCGLATFTKDLSSAIGFDWSGLTVHIVALNEPLAPDRTYQSEVCLQIDQNKQADYKNAASLINSSGADAVCLQHEYGLYGGADGEYIINLISELKKPLVTTLHTILEVPTKHQYEVLCKVVDLSYRVVVMAESAAIILMNRYGVDPKKISIIPHGVPLALPEATKVNKKSLGLEKNITVGTFGLINPGKGIEYAIEAVSTVVKQYPKIKLLILGVTHPNLIKTNDETYRRSLEKLAKKLGVEQNILFINKYLELDELTRYLSAIDIYISPYLNPQQITSGTLAYALGAGRVCISTPYLYAKETLADNRGILVPFRDSKALAEAILMIIKNKKTKKIIEKNAFNYSRAMLWPNVGARYNEIFRQAIG